jgi:hypothetical protein
LPDIKLRVLSLGAGVQSTTMALMAAHGEIGPMPDCAIFADTQHEPKVVYDHLTWLRGNLPYPVHIVTAGDLWESVTTIKRTKDGKRTYTETGLPVYTKGEMQDGLGKRQCTRAFKIDPINKEVKRLLGKTRIVKRDGVLVEMWIGISVDEIMRKKPNAKQYIRSRWPLIEQNFTRQSCLDWLKNNGYPLAPRSSCTFCPYHNDIEWLRLTSAEFADAVVKEKELQAAYVATTALNTTPFFHSARIPLGSVPLDSTPKAQKLYQLDMFNNECEGMCGV